MIPADALPEATLPAPGWLPWWRAELLRLYEIDVARLDDAAVVASLRAAAGEEQCKLLARAERLLPHTPLALPNAPFAGTARWLLLGLHLLSALLAAGSALALLGDGSRPVNVLWLLGALLGVPSLSLLLWLLSLLRRAQLPAPAPSRWLPRLLGLPAALGLRALLSVAAQGGWLRWGLGLCSHTLWAAALAGAMLALLLALALRSYGFIWETTVLPGSVFVTLISTLGALPALFGVVVPDSAQILASGGAPLMLAEPRRAWAGWLLGCLLIYGLLPRLLAALVCWIRLRRRMRGGRLDLQQPYYLALRHRLAPLSTRLGVVDAEAAELPTFRLGQRQGPPGRGNVVLSIELPGFVRPVGAGLTDLGDVDGREQQQRVIAAMQQQPAARGLICVDGRQSPDRGTLAFIAALSPWLDQLHVLLVGAANAERRSAWGDSLRALGLDASAVQANTEAAQRWLTSVGATP